MGALRASPPSAAPASLEAVFEGEVDPVERGADGFRLSADVSVVGKIEAEGNANEVHAEHYLLFARIGPERRVVVAALRRSPLGRGQIGDPVAPRHQVEIDAPAFERLQRWLRLLRIEVDRVDDDPDSRRV